jgi:hypothetical protein
MGEAKITSIAHPSRENRRMLGNARAVIVFGLVIDHGGRLLLEHDPFPKTGPHFSGIML